MKFKEPSNWPIQKQRDLKSSIGRRPKPWPGPPEEPIAFSGAYCVQPPQRRAIVNEEGRDQNEETL